MALDFTRIDRYGWTFGFITLTGSRSFFGAIFLRWYLGVFFELTFACDSWAVLTYRSITGELFWVNFGAHVATYRGAGGLTIFGGECAAGIVDENGYGRFACYDFETCDSEIFRRAHFRFFRATCFYDLDDGVRIFIRGPSAAVLNRYGHRA